ncbi:hypothetical protein BLNAU_22710 [Blattamonas nauphoetae]|uniref:Uncharacterized protein n=1 Tax=Blattamonas nauphoetae TaxID=2049346 RepID=A0ABQ9WSA4_9EUKA|nr:hypothetical protein BLNAU_22710 [Blattamonas nauphoetae]
MTSFDDKTDTSSNPARSDLPSSQLPFSTDFSPFLNWNEKEFETESEKAVVFRSLVAIVKLQPVLDDSLEAMAVKFLTSVEQGDEESDDEFLTNFGHTTDESLRNFIQSFLVLISSGSKTITIAVMEMLDGLTLFCSHKIVLALFKADLIPQLITTLNPHSLSFADAEDIHISLMTSLSFSLELPTLGTLAFHKINDRNEQQAVHETVLKQVVVPSEKYIWHLCVNRHSIIDGKQSFRFLALLARLLEICPYYQPTMEFVLHMPVVLTISSCLSFFEHENSIWAFLYEMINSQREWNKRGEVQKKGKTVHRMLRMEGIEDVTEERLQNDRNGDFGGGIVNKSIEWNNLLGMNLR